MSYLSTGSISYLSDGDIEWSRPKEEEFVPKNEAEEQLFARISEAAKSLQIHIDAGAAARTIAYGIRQDQQTPGHKVSASDTNGESPRNLMYIQDGRDTVVVAHLNKESRGDRNLGEDGSMGKSLKFAIAYNTRTDNISVYVVNSYAPLSDSEAEALRPNRRQMMRAGEKKQLTARHSAQNESRVLERLDGAPHTLPLVATVQGTGKNGQPKVYALLPFCEGGDLSGVIQSKTLTRKEKLRIAIDILKGAEEMHRAGIVHRDLTSRNIFFQNGIPVIADFDLASDVDQVIFDSHGTPTIRPPEFMKQQGAKCTPESDVYSLGCTLHELLFDGEVLIEEALKRQGKENLNPYALLSSLMGLSEDPMIEPENKDSFEHVIFEMTRLNPEARITLPEARARLERMLTGMD